MKTVKAKTTKIAPKVAAKAAPKGGAVKAAPKEAAVKGKKPKKVLPKGTPMSLDDTLWRLMNRPKKPTVKAKDAS